MAIESMKIRDNAETRAAVGTRMKFVVALEDGEDGYIVASCPALPGCHSQGRNRDEALVNIKEAIEGVVAVMIEDGEPIPFHTELHEIEVEV